MDDFVLNVRQIGQYPNVGDFVDPNDLLLVQQGIGGPYMSVNADTLVSTALRQEGNLELSLTAGLFWRTDATLSFDGNDFQITKPTNILSVNTDSITTGTLQATGDIAANGQIFSASGQLVSIGELSAAIDNTVTSFNFRTGAVQLLDTDILRAGGVLQVNPVFSGIVIVPTIWDPRADNDQAASTAFVQRAICHWLMTAPIVQTFNGRTGAITLTAADVTAAAYLEQGEFIRAPSPPLGDTSDRVATTAFVDESLMDLQDTLENEINDAISGNYAPINSPSFTGHPTAPTPAPGDNTGNLATTAFVHAAVVASTTGVSSFNTRTGAVTLQSADVTGVGGALLASPVFTGTPQAPTQTAGNSSTAIATTAFVGAAIAAIPTAGVSSFNTRTGAVVLNTADITSAGGAPIASPGLTGTPTAPTAAPGVSTTQIATTAFVAAAVAASTAGVSSFNTRTGAVTLQANDISAVGGAMLASPAFSGIPTAPTATTGTNTAQLATTAFVQNQIAAIASGVSSFNTRTGAVTLTAADVTSAGGALLASPALTGVPTAPTAAQTSNDTTLATTAYVRAAIAANPGGVTSFNTRTGAITLTFADVSAAGGAPINSPSFTGTVTSPTPTAGTNSTQVATTAFVMSALSTAGGVNSFNGRAGVVTLTSADISGASGALLAQTIPQCGRFQLGGTSPSQSISFIPFNGAQIKINGAIRQFASLTMTSTAATINGVTGQSVAPSTTYFVYAYWTGTAVALDLSTTGHSTSVTAGNEGTEIKTGDDTRTLVGIVRALVSAPSSNSFQDDGTQRLVRSWFNRAPTTLNISGSNASMTATSPISISSGGFVSFAGEKIKMDVVAQATATAQLNCNTYLYLDGTSLTGNGVTIPAGFIGLPSATVSTAISTEGYHTFENRASVSSSQANYSSVLTGVVV